MEIYCESVMETFFIVIIFAFSRERGHTVSHCVWTEGETRLFSLFKYKTKKVVHLRPPQNGVRF